MDASIGAGDEFGRLIDEHRRIVFKVAHTYAWREDDRADLVQDILAQLWRAFPAYDRSRSFSTWMYRVALNVAISALRTRQRRDRHTVPFDDDMHDVADDRRDRADADERVRTLYRVIDGLDGLNRALLLLYLDEHSYRQIAEILGITETNVATKLNRLKQRLRTDMETAGIEKGRLYGSR